ncbi:MAG: Gfo/Idh/MocA family oxidoreductase [Lentisphaerae bacterium]|nr:Gfo/Idh/MocA family oxidoreductase [Lentisphaerota bacterium]
MKTTLRVGMIGAGAIAFNHCSGINSHPQAKVVAVADLNRRRAKTIQKKFGIDKTATQWKDIISDPDIDAVSVALPNMFHAPVAIAALKAGKHVMLDKPFAMNRHEAERIIDAAKEAGKTFMLGMNIRFMENVQRVKALTEKGELGEIYHAKAYYLRQSGAPKFGTWFCNKKLSGGGCMLDIGVHMLDSCLYLMNNWQPVSVFGSTYTKFGNRGIGEGSWGMSDKGKQVFDVDDFATALIKFKNGATVQLDASWVLLCETPKTNIELFGTKGGAAAFPTARLFKFGKKGKFDIKEPKNVKIAYPKCNRFVNWVDVILGKDKPMCTPAQALTVQKILDGIYESSKTGKEVRIR